MQCPDPCEPCVLCIAGADCGSTKEVLVRPCDKDNICGAYNAIHNETLSLLVLDQNILSFLLELLSK